MRFQPEWDTIQTRLEALWQREIVDRCCIVLMPPKEKRPDPYPPPEDAGALREYWLDSGQILARNIGRWENTVFMGDAFPCAFPNYGPAGHAKYFQGAKWEYTKDSMWIHPSIEDLETQTPVYDPNSAALLAELDSVRGMAQGAGEDFLVGMLDNCGMLDALAGLRGNAQLLVDLIERPEAVERALKAILAGWMDAQTRFFELVKDNNFGGSSHPWMYTWSPGRHAQLQVDFAAMISPAMYERFALPELQAICDFLDHSLYHLDGMEQICHLDLILSVERLDGIQWTHVNGQPGPLKFLPELQRIQAAGKMLILMPPKQEVRPLLEGLSSKGLQMIVGGLESQEEAQYYLDLAEKLTHD